MSLKRFYDNIQDATLELQESIPMSVTIQALTYEKALREKFDPLFKLKYPAKMPDYTLETQHQYITPLTEPSFVNMSDDIPENVANFKAYCANMKLMQRYSRSSKDEEDFYMLLSYLESLFRFRKKMKLGNVKPVTSLLEMTNLLKQMRPRFKLYSQDFNF